MPAGNPNVLEAGKNTRFSSTNQPENRGRKPDKLKGWIEEYDLSKHDVHSTFINFLYDKSLGEIEAILADKKKRSKLPLALAIQLQVLTNAAKRGDARHFENILYMLFGKPKESHDITGGLQLKTLTEAEAKALET